MKKQCPRCNEYEYESSYSNRQLGCLIMIVVPLVIGGGAAYSGMSDDMVGYLTIGALILGLFIISMSYLRQQKTLDWTCKKCGFTQTHEF